jgi:hypothetical protein
MGSRPREAEIAARAAQICGSAGASGLKRYRLVTIWDDERKLPDAVAMV